MTYTAPPFNTGKVQRRENMQVVQDDGGTRVGFGGRTYAAVRGAVTSYDDFFEDYWSFLEPRLVEAWRLLRHDGTLYLHLDDRERHSGKDLLVTLFVLELCQNEYCIEFYYASRYVRRH